MLTLDDFLRSRRGPVEGDVYACPRVYYEGSLRTRGDRFDAINEALLLQTFDTKPLYSFSLLTSTRPHRDLFAEGSPYGPDGDFEYATASIEGMNSAIRFTHSHSGFAIDLGVLCYFNNLYLDGIPFYEIRVDSFDITPECSNISSYFQDMARCLGARDYADAKLIAECGNNWASRTCIERYARTDTRRNHLFVIAKDKPWSAGSAARKSLRSLLRPMGVVAEATPDWLDAQFGMPERGDYVAAFRAGCAAPELLEVSFEHGQWQAKGLLSFLRASPPDDQTPWFEDGYSLPDWPSPEGAPNPTPIDGVVGYPLKVRALVRRANDQALAEAAEATTGVVAAPPPPILDAIPPAYASISARNLLDVEERHEPVLDAEGFPTKMADLADWVAATLGDRLTMAPRAIREIRKSRHPEPGRIARALLLLAGPRLDNFRGARSALEQFGAGLSRIYMRDGFSNAERLSGISGKEYIIRIEKETVLLKRHLRSISGGFNDPRLIRIYYDYNSFLDRIVVGWIPSHLTTTQS